MSHLFILTETGTCDTWGMVEQWVPRQLSPTGPPGSNNSSMSSVRQLWKGKLWEEKLQKATMNSWCVKKIIIIILASLSLMQPVLFRLIYFVHNNEKKNQQTKQPISVCCLNNRIGD